MFEPDGSLVDVFVKDTTSADWSSLLQLLRSGAWPVSYCDAGEKKALPSEFPGYDDRMLEVSLRGIKANCHFFDEDEIEFDIDPQDVRGEADYEELLKFMKAVAAILQKPMCLSGEGSHDGPCLVVLPNP